jgi:uncharacterized protein YdeI (YjbR/CyaY-like superfamily)
MDSDVTISMTGGRPEMAVPHDLQIALHGDPAAGAAFEALPYSHKREYIDWILEARRPETRARRIDEALRMIAEKARSKR